MSPPGPGDHPEVVAPEPAGLTENGTAAPDMPRPTAASPMGSGTLPPPAPPPRSSARMVVYVAIFGCLVAISLVLRAQSRSPLVTPPSSSPVNHPPAPSTTPTMGTTGPSAIVDSGFARQSCTRPDVLQGGFRLIAAFETTAAIGAAWEDALSQEAYTSPLHGVTPTAKVAVCYIDGPWQPPASVADLYRSEGLTPDRGLVFVTDTQQVIAGPIAPHESLPILRPAAPPAAAPSVTSTDHT